MRPELESGVPGGEYLLAFCDALIGTDRQALDEARTALADALSPAAVTGAASVAACFSKNDRIANGSGIPVAAQELKKTEDIRKQLGLDDFRSAVNSFRHITQ